MVRRGHCPGAGDERWTASGDCGQGRCGEGYARRGSCHRGMGMSERGASAETGIINNIRPCDGHRQGDQAVGVVKANAYGHKFRGWARPPCNGGLFGRVDSRRGRSCLGGGKPHLDLGYVAPGAERAVANSLTTAIFSPHLAEALNTAAGGCKRKRRSTLKLIWAYALSLAR